MVSLEDVNAIPSHKPVSSLVYTCRPSDVSHVVVDGRLVLDDGEVVTMEEREVLQRGRAVARRLVEESGTRHLLVAPRPVLIS